MAIKSQRYLATFCPTSKLHIDDITIKANGPLTTYNLFGVTYGNGNHSKSAMCPCHRPGGTSMMACENIIKEDQDFRTVESHKSPLLPLPI